MGVLILVIEAVAMLRKGPWDWLTCATAVLSLFAAFSGVRRPQTKLAYYTGGIALIAMAARAGWAAWDLVQLQHRETRLPQLAPYPGIVAVLLAWLTLVYFFGRDSRAYFLLK